MSEEILRLENIIQFKEERKVLDNFNLRVLKGEIMGLIFLNDYGKEALIELLCENVPIHYGRVYFDEVLINNYEYSSQRRNKVAIIDKKSRLVDDLTVSDNIFVIRKGFKKYLINRNILNSQLKMFMTELNINIDGNKIVRKLSAFERCIVEILKAMIGGIKLIVVKDLSNYLSSTELIKFQNIIKYYCEAGISFIYICSHHEEAYKICNRLYLSENGRIQKILNKNDFTEEKIGPYIIDFNEIKINEFIEENKEGILKFKNIWTKNLKGMNFKIKKGQCTIILDLSNTALEEIVSLINGNLQPIKGSLIFEGNNYFKKKHINIIKNGVAFIGEEPIKNMIFEEMSYMDNLCFLIDRKKNGISLSRRIRKSIVNEYEPLVGEDIYEKDISNLSFTALYSLIYYRIHLYNPKIVFCFQPFYGADMYLRKHIINLINELKKRGITVIIIGIALEDSLILGDHLIVIEEGKVRNEYDRNEFNYIDKVNV